MDIQDYGQLSEKCAVFGVYSAGLEASRLTFYGLWTLQHRGQESSGIVSSYNGQLHRHASAGLVSNVYREEDLEQLPGDIAIGHNRYSTSGGKDDAHVQPIVKSDGNFAFAHNGNLPTTDSLEEFLDSKGIDCLGLNDSDMMAEAINYYVTEGMELDKAIEKAYPLFEGAFSSVAMNDHQLVAFRDKCGIRPLAIGKLENEAGYILASETCALDVAGATYVREVQPGEIVVIDKRGLTSLQVAHGKQKLDIFEFVYFARPDSNLLGRNVGEVRKSFGKQLASECLIEADMVVPVPDSAIPAAQGYSRATGIPLEMALVKNRYIHRTFIRPTAELRERDLKMKLNPIPELIKDQRVIIVDDSIVRGTTLRKIVSMVRSAGAREVHVLVSSPPVLYPDFYGINTPIQSDLIAAYNTVEEIRKLIGANSLNYLSYQGMLKATGLPAHNFSTSCFNGVYPIGIGDREKEFAKI
jgi:amidophosphoribosyltransferase